MSLICEGLGEIIVATYQSLLSMSDLAIKTLPANVNDFRYPRLAICEFISETFLSQTAVLLKSLNGKVNPRVGGGCRVCVSTKGVLVLGGEVDRGVSADLCQFMTAPDTSEKFLSNSTSLSTFLSSLMKNVESSAKAALLSVPLGVSMPSISVLAATKSSSSAKTKSRGAIGSPWGTPCRQLKCSVESSTVTSAFLLKKRSFIVLENSAGNPKASKQCKSHL